MNLYSSLGHKNFHAFQFITYSELNGPSTITTYIRILVDKISSILNSIRIVSSLIFCLSFIHQRKLIEC